MPCEHSIDSLHKTTTCNITHNTESTAFWNLTPELGVHHWFKGRSARRKQNSQRNKDDNNNFFFSAKWEITYIRSFWDMWWAILHRDGNYPSTSKFPYQLPFQQYFIFIHLSSGDCKKGLSEAAVLTAVKPWIVSQSTLMSSVRFLQQTVTTSLHSVHKLFFLIEAQCFLCEVWTEIYT